MLDSSQVRNGVRRAVAAVTGFILLLVSLVALLTTGLYLLVQAAIMALLPVTGEAAAMALVGLGCLLLLASFFWRMMVTGAGPGRRKGKSQSAGGPSMLTELRELIRENPLESALTAFAVGMVQQSDPRLKALLLQGGMELMKRGEISGSPAPPDQGPLAGGNQP